MDRITERLLLNKLRLYVIYRNNYLQKGLSRKEADTEAKKMIGEGGNEAN